MKNILMSVVVLTAGWAAFTLLPAQEPAPAGAKLKTKVIFSGGRGVYTAGTPVTIAVTGAPYSAVAVTDMTQTLGDGNRIVHSQSVRLYRDGQGRERTEALEGGEVTISDPVAKTSYRLDAVNRTASPGGMVNLIALSGNVQATGGQTFSTLFRLDDNQIATMAAATAQATALNAQAIAVGEKPVTENLGTQNFEGVNANGTRSTVTIPARQLGNERPIQIVDESWYSPDLKMTVMTKHSDPRSGETVYRLTQISRAEPDARLFQLPSDYTVTGGGGAIPAVGGRGGRGPAPVTGVAPEAVVSVPGIPLVGGPSLLARVTNRVEPQYTEQARAAKWQGSVTLSLVVDETGKPSNIAVVKSLGMGLDEAAITAVEQWRFQPTQINGAPTKVQARIEVPFRLQ